MADKVIVIKDNAKTIIKVAGTDQVIPIIKNEVIKVIALPRGPAGAPGRDGESNEIEIEAGEPIPSFRVVGVVLSGMPVPIGKAKILKNDPLYIPFVNQTIGISLNAVNTGEMVRIKTFGLIEDLSLGFLQVGRLYCDSNGIPTTNLPTNGFILEIGKCLARNEGKIFVDIKQPIILGE